MPLKCIVTEETHLNSLAHIEAKVLLPIYSQAGLNKVPYSSLRFQTNPGEDKGRCVFFSTLSFFFWPS